MANDFYLNDEQEAEEDNWNLLQQEFHECQVLNDVVALIASKGLPSILATILQLMEERQ